MSLEASKPDRQDLQFPHMTAHWITEHFSKLQTIYSIIRAQPMEIAGIKLM